jgi:hypothetical protein
MSECHHCLTAKEIEQGTWKDVPFDQTPCAKCQLREDSFGTLEYQEGHINNSTLDNPDDEDWIPEVADDQTTQPYSRLDCGGTDDPQVPLSTLVSAMSLFLSLSLPARKAIQLRMHHIPYSQIAQRLGCSRQAVEKLVAQALAKQPLLGNLLPSKSARSAAPLTATRASAIADNDKVGKNHITASHRPHFVRHCEPRTA